VVDIGEVATLDKPPGNTTPLSFPAGLGGDIVHMNIIFGSGTALGGYIYTIFGESRH